MSQDAVRHLAFVGSRRLADGPLTDVADVARSALAAGGLEPVIILNAETGAVVDFDPRPASARTPPARDPAHDPAHDPAPAEPAPARGRPRLGVVAREVTLLPRHWDWLAAQSGGASAALRRLIDAARKADGEGAERRQRRDLAYRLMSVLAGNLPGFEEAARALFAGETEALQARMARWPSDVRDEILRALAAGP